MVDAYRRIRNTLRFLLANTSDFDPAKDAVPPAEMLEIDRWALARAAQFQAEVLAHYEVYEFHPVVAKLQVFCSEDLGAFYLDVLKDRLYTTAPKSLARRSRADRAVAASRTPCCAGWRRSSASRPRRRGRCSRRARRRRSSPRPTGRFDAPDEALLAKWTRIREIRDVANKEIEAVRTAGEVGSSLQANADASPRPPPTTRCWPRWATT